MEALNLCQPVDIELKANICISIAECHYHLGEYRKALEGLESCSGLEAGINQEVKTKFLMVSGTLQVGMGQFAKAKVTLNELQGPDDVLDIHFCKALGLIEMGLFQMASAILLTLKPQVKKLETSMDTCWKIQKAKYEALLGYCRLAMDDTKKDGMKDLEKSMELWDQVPKIKHSPDIIYAHIFIGEAKLKRRDYNSAYKYLEMGFKYFIQMYNECLKYHPLYAKLTCLLGLVHIGEKDFTLAKEHFDEALAMVNKLFEDNNEQLCPTLVWIHEGLAKVAYHCDKNTSKAKVELELACQMAQKVYPEDSDFLTGGLKKFLESLET